MPGTIPMECPPMSYVSRAGLASGAIFALLGGVIACQTPAAAAEPQTYQLRFKFSPQQELYYVTQNDAEYLIEHAEVKQTIPHTSMTIRHIQVLDLNPDGSANVKLVIDRARMTAKNEGVESLYDSRDAAHVPTEFAAVHKSIGNPVPAQLTTLGKTLPAKETAKETTANVEQYDLLFQLPEQPIAMGAIWKDNFEAEVQIAADSMLHRQIKLQRRYELKSVENGIATISLNTVPLTPLHDPFQESQLVQRKPSGTLKFDIERGCLIDRQLRIDEKVVGHAGPGSALTVQVSKVDRWVSADQLQQVDLTKPLVPVRVAARP